MIPLVPGVHVLFVSFLSLQFEYIHTDKSVFLKFEHLFWVHLAWNEDVAGNFWTLHFLALVQTYENSWYQLPT